ncbi:MAG: carbohydrate kinase family protein [Patescibacteria group bacterium]|jgi:sugar/nucleoside kinase (ribokinase family)
MKYDFIAIGGAVEDITLYVQDGQVINNPKDILRQKLVAFEYGAKISANKCFRFLGGGANNAATCLSRLGFTVGLLSSVGNDEFGRELFENLDENNIDTRLVRRIHDVSSGFSVVVVGPSGEHTAFVYRGAADLLEIGQVEKEMLACSKWLYISSLSGNWENILDKVFSVKGPAVVWNPGIVQLKAGVTKLKKYLKKTEILFVNKDEAIELAISENKYKKQSEKLLKDDRALIEALKNFGSKKVVITDGENGADYFDGEIFYHGNPLRVPENKIADTTGIGDTFCSTFVAGLEIYQGDFKKAMKLAMKNAASVLKKSGAQNGLMEL